jgi:hypothetical protein
MGINGRILANHGGGVAAMEDESRNVLSLMADGAERSFDLLQIVTHLGPSKLRAVLESLRKAELLECKIARDTQWYVITLKGFIELKDCEGPPPLYRE